MRKEIDRPKVFISYAWGAKDYQNKVIAFAEKLVGDGIEVVLDKWDLKEGNDAHEFMERSVNDSSVTNVLMLLNPVYAEKADGRIGGVGTETQIISAEIYRNTRQDKFIPIVMERDENGRVCVPTYLKSRLYFDLTASDGDYYSVYERIVKALYGVEVYPKPKLGKEPDWVTKPKSADIGIIASYDSLKNIQPEKVAKIKFNEYLEKIKTMLIDYSQSESRSEISLEEYISLYNKSEEIRENYLQLIKNSIYIEKSHESVAVFFEETKNALNGNPSISGEVVGIRIHELFLYTIAFYLKNEDYSAAGHMLGRTYLTSNPYGGGYKAADFGMFFSKSQKRYNLDRAISIKSNRPDLLTGTGQCWMDTISNDFCSKEELVFADLICFNYSVYGKDFDGWKWFPVVYVYDNQFGILSKFGKRMISREHVQKVLPLFNFETVESFATKVKEIEEQSETRREVRYPNSFEYAPLLGEFIKSKDFASLR